MNTDWVLYVTWQVITNTDLGVYLCDTRETDLVLYICDTEFTDLVGGSLVYWINGVCNIMYTDLVVYVTSCILT